MSSSDKNKADKTKTIRKYAKYSGIAYQMIGLVAMSVFLGLKADKYFGNEESKYITVFLVIVVFTAFMYRLYKTL